MFGAIKYNLSHLATFRGRDARSTFWYYLLAVVIVRFIAAIAISLPVTVRMTAVAVEAAQNGADAAAVQAQTIAAMAETLPLVTGLGLVLAIVTALLLVASLVRRLHDIGMSGWWAFLPAGLQVIALAQTSASYRHVMDTLTRADGTASPNPALIMQGQGGMIALMGWLPAMVVIIIGLIKPNDGPNRFGEAPARF